MQRHLVTNIGPWSRGTEEGIRHKQQQCTDGCVTWPSALNLIGHLRQDDTHPVISHSLITRSIITKSMDF